MDTPQSPNSQDVQGFEEPGFGSDEYLTHRFLIEQLISGVWTITLGQIVAVYPPTEPGGPGTVDLQPMVHQIDGRGQVTPHGTIYGLPYFQLQSGANAVIMPPAVGDIGMVAYAMRDISVVKATAAPGPPGSRRSYDPADGLYLGSFLGVTPNQYIMFNGSGISIVTPNTVNIQAKNLTVNATTKITMTAPEIDLISNNVNLGNTGGAKVARVGDTVSGGVITSGSSEVKSA